MAKRVFSRIAFLYLVMENSILLSLCQTECSDKSEKQNITVSVRSNWAFDHYGRRQIINTEKEVTNKLRINCKHVTFPLQIKTKLESCENNCSSALTLESIVTNPPVLPKGAFSDYRFNILNLNKTGISAVSPGAFASEFLTEINLSFNKLTEIDVGVFSSLNKLTTLDLSNNNIYKISSHTFLGCLKLKSLNFSKNSLTHFSWDVFDPSNTEFNYVDLSFNNLTYIKISDKYRLTDLYLNHNFLISIDICPFIIRKLEINNNLLKSLPRVMCNNKNSKENELTYFDVSFNRISKLDTLYFNNSDQSNLTDLYLNNNSLKTIPNGFFFNLFHLKVLNLSHNYLQEFDHGTFDSLEELNILDLSSNNIADIKNRLHNLKSLHNLYLQHNQISNLDGKQIIKDFPDLFTISFYDNKFTCDNLHKLVSELKNVLSYRGKTATTSNIIGISCSGNNSSANDKHETFEGAKENFEKFLTSILKESNIGGQNKKVDHDERYYDNFYKFLKNFQDLNIKFNDTGFFKYFNEDFRKSNFFKYLESLKDFKSRDLSSNKNDFNQYLVEIKNITEAFLEHLQDSGNRQFQNSQLYKYFNGDFENSKFYKYLENLKYQNNNEIIRLLEDLRKSASSMTENSTNKTVVRQINILGHTENFGTPTTSEFMHNVKSQKLKYSDDFENRMLTAFSSNNIILIVSVILNCCMFSIYMYKSIVKKRKENKERIELFDSKITDLNEIS